MALADYQLAIRTLALGPGTNYLVHGVDGLGSADVRTSDVERPMRNGDFLGIDTYASRVVTLDVTVRGDTPELNRANYDTLAAAWQLLTGEITTNLDVKFPNLPQLSVFGRPRRLAVTDSFARLKGRRIAVSLEFYSPDPTLYSSDQTTSTLSLATPSTGRIYPRTYPLAYGGGVSGLGTMTNAGNFAVWPVIRLNGGSSGATNPSVLNVDTGAVLTYADVLAAGDFVEIDTDARTVLLNGTANVRGSMAGLPGWFSLPPGDTDLRFSADSGTDCFAEIVYRSGWLA